jgi:chaperonin GroEL
MPKDTLFGEKALQKLQKGVEILANATKGTLGPKGKVVVFRRGDVIFADDGVTIAQQIELEDQSEAMGAELIKGVAAKTDKEAGDGTTTSIILAQFILREGLKSIAAGADTLVLRKGIAKALKIAVETIKKISKPLKGNKDISDVGTIASKDPEIGKIISEIVGKIGKDAIIAVEESNVVGMGYELVKGLQFDKGYISPYMMTHPDRGEAIIDKPYILTTSQVISTNQDIVNLLEEVIRSDSKALVVIADDVSGEALQTLVINKLQGRMRLAAIKAPGFGEDKIDQLQDIAILTGAKLIAEETGTKVEDTKLEDLGRADRVIVLRDRTIIIGGKGRKAEVQKRTDQLAKLIKNEKSEYKQETMKKRLGKMKGGVAVIKVGTISEQENKEKRYRVEDAVKATMSAIEEGIVPGGGIALLEASKKIEQATEKEKDISLRMGMNILSQAIKEPAYQIIRNAGGKEDVIIAKVEEGRKTMPAYGYNSDTEEYGDLFEQGVIDPCKVVRCALENAVSVVSLFLITDACIADLPDDKKNDKV